MSEYKDKILMRSKDVILIIGAVGGLLTALGKIFVLANAVEIQQKKIEEMEPKVIEHSTKIAVNDDRWEQIQRELNSINRKLDRRER